MQASSADTHKAIQSIDSIITTTTALLAKVNEYLSKPELQSDNGPVTADIANGKAEEEIKPEDGGSILCWGGGLSSRKKNVGSRKAESAPNGGSSGANGGGGGSSNSEADASASCPGSNGPLRHQVEKLQRDLIYIESALTKFRNLEAGFGSPFKNIEEHRRSLDQIMSSMTQVQGSTSATNIQQVHNNYSSISDVVMHLKRQIPSLRKPFITNTNADQLDAGCVFNTYYLVNDMPKQRMKDKVLGAPAFKEFFNDLLCVFEDLDLTSKLCLLCFSVFPENAVLRKRLLVNWWIGEGLVDPGEANVDDIFKKLIAKGFTEPVLKKRKLIGFKMDPLVRFVVIAIAEKVGYFGFNSMGVPTEDFSRSHRACLVRTEGQPSQEGLTKYVSLDPEERSRRNASMDPEEKTENVNLDPGKLGTIFNVNDPYPYFKLDWFSKMKNLNVLYLGSWQDFAKHHIEVEGTEFLKGLKHMKHLQFLSLQGISRITELPNSICDLTSLKILDLNACHNLELLPKKIGALKKLTHLDISQCYLLDHIPKAVSLLTELQVLKGFVIGDLISRDTCALEDLAGLLKLRKLSVYIGREDFPTEKELNVLEGFEKLEKLTIVWGWKPSKENQNKNSKQQNSPANSRIADSVKMGDKTNSTKTQKDNVSAQQNEPSQPARTASAARRKLSRSFAFKGRTPTETSSANPGDIRGLQKLELQCFPGPAAPAWLTKGKLMPQKSLYLRGGNLQSLCMLQDERIKWKVKILCLKFLSELKMDWGDLQKSFPELIYLEKVKCPKLTFFPCDERGVWSNRKMDAKQMEELKLDLSWSFLRREDTVYPIPVSSATAK